MTEKESSGPTSGVSPGPTKVPGPFMQFLWDMLPKNSPDWLLPRRSGLKPPNVNLDWITREIAEHPDALEQTRSAHDRERESVALVESKAGTMVAICLTLLATAIALGGYQVKFLRGDHHATWLWITPALLSIVLFAWASVTSLETLRVGLYQWEGAEPLGREPGGRLGLVQSEETGRRFANATARMKANRLLQAWAWMSRALAALTLSAIVSIAMATRPDVGTPRSPSSTSTRTTQRMSTTTPASAGSSVVLYSSKMATALRFSMPVRPS